MRFRKKKATTDYMGYYESQQEPKQHGKFYLTVRRFCRNKAAIAGLVFILVLIFGAVFADRLTPYVPDAQNLAERLQYPSAAHLMGTDDFGRDIFTRVLYGGRISLLVSAMTVAIGTIFALIIGAISGYAGGKVDMVIMRITDVFLALPGMIFAMVISAALGNGLINTAIALAISSIAPMTRQIRSSILLIKNQEYIEASRAFGGSHFHIVASHVIPNSLTPVIVQASMSLGDTIMGIAGLSFLGLGVQPPTPEWGNMLTTAQKYVDSFWPMMFWPGLAIALTMLAFNVLGDGVRDALDPRMKL